MDEWNDYAADLVDGLARADLPYRELYQQAKELEPAFQTLYARLSDAEKEALDGYMCAHENMEYRKSQLAYFLGKSLKK